MRRSMDRTFRYNTFVRRGVAGDWVEHFSPQDHQRSWSAPAMRAIGWDTRLKPRSSRTGDRAIGPPRRRKRMQLEDTRKKPDDFLAMQARAIAPEPRPRFSRRWGRKQVVRFQARPRCPPCNGTAKSCRSMLVQIARNRERPFDRFDYGALVVVPVSQGTC
jgi:hypothetical protein